MLRSALAEASAPERRSPFPLPFIVALLVGLVLVPSADATYPGKRGDLVFLREQQRGEEFYYQAFSATPRGTRVRRLKIPETLFVPALPDFSPDRRMVTFDSGFSIWTIGLSGMGLRQLTARVPMVSLDSDPTYSPTGRQIAFIRADDIQTGTVGSAVWVMSADGVGPRRLVSGFAGQAFQPRYAPGGRRIFFLTDRDAGIGNQRGRVDLYSVDRDGGQAKRLTSRSLTIRGFDVSPDGKQFVLGIARASNPSYSDIYTMKADGTRRKRISSDGASPVWAPDSSAIAAVDHRDRVIVMKTDGKRRRKLSLTSAGGLVWRAR